MDVEDITKKVKEARELSKKRNFTQTFDLVYTLQQIDLKKPEHKVEVGITLSSPVKPKPYKICAVVERDLTDAENVFDKVLYKDQLEAVKGDMDEIRKITHGSDKFVVQSSIMPTFAQILGRYLGPMNKMPSPKLGMVITDKTPLQPLYDTLQKTVQLATRKNTVVQVPVGPESENDEVIAHNITTVDNALFQALPNYEQNTKSVKLKLTMGKPVVL